MIQILPHEKIDILSKYKQIIEDIDVVQYCGRVDKIVGLTIESIGPDVKYGDLCKIKLDEHEYLYAEVVGLNRNRVILMPIGELKGVKPGASVYSAGESLKIPVGNELLGRVINGTGEPMDGKGRIFSKNKYPIEGKSVNPLERDIISQPLSLGIRAIDGLNTIGKGQRIGIFAGSGVGKSTLLGMIAKHTSADVNVIALIGERGREVKEFVESILGEEGMKRSVVVVATSDQPPTLRLRGAYTAHTIAEYFRDQGLHVNLMMDSVTRFAMAQREIALAAGEPTSTRGYPPSVFSMLPRLLERAGTKHGGGSITGLYTVLVEADDMNEPISDHVRSILDGHIVLNRKMAHKGHYPAIDVLASISRCMTSVTDREHKKAAQHFRELLAAFTESEDMIMLGGYQRGSSPITDKAIDMISELNNFLKQGMDETETYENTREKIIALFREEDPKKNLLRDTPSNPYLNYKKR